MKLPLYMDNHSTTRVDPRVLDAMLPYFTEKFGNAASRNHPFGWEAEEAVEVARAEVAGSIGATAKEIVFTSGATESDNLALKGVMAANAEKGRHLVTLATEHKAILDTAKALAQAGHEVTVLGVKPDGLVDVDALRGAIRADTVLVSIMAVNNEIGVVQPLAIIGQICRERGALFHTDAAQAAGKIALDVEAMRIDLASLSAHKTYGPKGVGALYVRRQGPRVRLAPMMDGGGHERGRRSGTLNVPGVVGLGRACAIAAAERDAESARIGALRDRLLVALQERLDGVRVNGSLEHRVAGNLNVSFARVEGEALLLALKDHVAVSSGAACTSETVEPSHVLRALGAGDDVAHTSIRFGLGRFNTAEEVDYVAETVVREVRRLREMSPLYELEQKGVDPATLGWTTR